MKYIALLDSERYDIIVSRGGAVLQES